MIKYTLFLVMLISASTCGAQPANQNHEGNWEGILPDTKVFNFKILFEQVEANSFDLTIANNTASFKKHFAAKSLDTIRIDLDEMVQLTLLPENNQKELTGFIRSGILMYPVHLKKTGAKIYTGTWNPFMVVYFGPSDPPNSVLSDPPISDPLTPLMLITFRSV